jgi:molecular chaperone GrpE
MSQNEDNVEDFAEGSDEQGTEAAQAASVEEQLRESNEKYLRCLAEFDNFRKRALKERSDLLKYQGERIFQDLLEVVDNFDLAVNHQHCDLDQMRQGLSLIHQMFQSFLTKWEVKGISAVGQSFDPNCQNAISTAPAADGLQPGQVVAELKKAFFYKDKLLRPGEVIVAVEPVQEG